MNFFGLWNFVSTSSLSCPCPLDYGWYYCQGRYTLAVKPSDFTVWRHTWGKNWVNCAVLTGNSAGLKTVLSSRLSHRELRSSLRKSLSFLSLPADTTMASSQGTQLIQQTSIAWYIPFQILHMWLFFSSFRITLWPMWLANSKRQPFFLSTIVTRTRRHTELTKKLTKLMGNLCCVREHSVQFFVQFFTQLNCTV